MPSLREEKIQGSAIWQSRAFCNTNLPTVSLWTCFSPSLILRFFVYSVQFSRSDPWAAAHQASLSIINSLSLPKVMSIESVMPPNYLILCRLFQWVSFSNPKYWIFSFSISPSSEYSVLISIRIDWLNILVVQGTLKSVFQHHSSKASVLWCSAFFIVQPSHSYMTIGKTIVLTKWTFVGKVMPLLFNILPRLVEIFLPRSTCLLISWL